MSLALRTVRVCALEDEISVSAVVNYGPVCGEAMPASDVLVEFNDGVFDC